jgi:hypothetical protein
MATPSAVLDALEGVPETGLQDELRQAEGDFGKGEFVEVTIEDLDRCFAAGEWPWSSELMRNLCAT